MGLAEPFFGLLGMAAGDKTPGLFGHDPALFQRIGSLVSLGLGCWTARGEQGLAAWPSPLIRAASAVGVAG